MNSGQKNTYEKIMSITTLSLLVVILACFIMGFKRPAMGVVGYLFVYVVYNPEAWYGQQLTAILFRPSLVVALMLCIVCLINTHKLTWKFSRREIEIYVFMIICFIVSFFFGIGVRENNWIYLEKLLKLSIFLFFLFRSVHQFPDYQMVVWTLIGGGVFVAVQAHWIGGYVGSRLNDVGGTDFSEANAFAAFMAMNMIFLGFKLFKKKWWIKCLIAIPVAVMLNALMMTQSRGVFIGLFFCLIYVGIRSPIAIKKEVIIYISLAIVLFFMLAHDKFWERMGTIEDESSLLSQENSQWNDIETPTRIDFWRSSIDIFKDYPLGIGVKNFEVIVPRYDYRNPGKDAHNTYVLCYSEIGIIGIILFIIIIFEAITQLRRINHFSKQKDERFELRIAAFSLTVVLILYLTGPMMTHSYLYSEFTWIFLSLPVCLENSMNHQIAIETTERV